MARTRSRNRNRMIDYPWVSVSGSSSHNYPTYAEAVSRTKLTVRNEQTLERDEMVDGITPEFFRKKKAGEFMPNVNLSVLKSSSYPATAGYRSIETVTRSPNPPVYVAHGSNAVVNTVAPTKSLISASDKDRVAQAALARLQRDGMDWVTSISEVHKTLAMIRNLRRTILKRLSEVLTALGNLKRFASYAAFYNAFSSLWLEGRFGWRILYFELKSLNDYVQNMDKGFQKFFARESITETYELNETIAVRDGVSRIIGSASVSSTVEESLTVGYNGIGDLSKLGSINLLNTAYDVMPWTVVLDMFFNIQDAILAWAPSSSRVDRADGSFMSHKRRAVQTAFIDINDVKGAIIESQSFPGVSFKETITRTNPPDFPFDISFKLDIGGLKAVDLIAFIGPLMRAFANGRSSTNDFGHSPTPRYGLIKY